MDSSFHLKRLISTFHGVLFDLFRGGKTRVGERNFEAVCVASKVNKTGRYRVGQMSLANNPFFRKG